MLIKWFLLFTLLHSIVGDGAAAGEGLHLPLYRTERRRVVKRDSGTAAIGLGDVLDVTYNVLVEIGGVSTPLVLDSGSADLWVISDSCRGSCTAGVPLYPNRTFQEAGMDVHILYGDSHTGTHAFGPIGKDRAGIASLSVQEQYFAAIIDTNTTVLETGSAGILGIGFPPISVLWRQLLQAHLSTQPPSIQQRSNHFPLPRTSTSPFPSFDFLQPHNSRPQGHYLRQVDSLRSSTQVIASFGLYGPLITRMIQQHLLTRPVIATSLQRDTVDIGGNVGLLSIGALLPGISDDALTWVPLRAYSVAEGGLPPPIETPEEVYPLVWEIPMEDVWFNGVKLQRSKLAPPNITLSALIDTGNSLIRGPQDVISEIQSLIGSMTFDCAQPQNLSFQIAGKLFPVDPRDFLHQTFADSVDFCSPALAVTDQPKLGGTGFLFGWSLGDPFLKSVLTAFHYGNLTHPSQDPPRIGLLSTVPSNAGDRLKEVVQEAKEGDGNLIMTSEAAPSGTFLATSTGVGGVPQATAVQPQQPPRAPDTSSSSQYTSLSHLKVLHLIFVTICLCLPFI
ncbi:acid protease [Cristinia sonorae]|uniref:Acid protease n=1 Tax=Cristinia sonorae TaxID=1940300 RepID=A0A8K0UG92_9AGAR|nr:acid protease [Cristinia sonorae]